MDPRLDDIAETLDALARLELDRRAPVDGRGDVIERLATGVNAIADQLAASQADLERRVRERAAAGASRDAEMGGRALYDPLTRLPNRTLFMDRLAQAHAAVARRGGDLAVLLVDVDHFKGFNETLGHAAGDRLLIEVAGRLRAHVRPGDTAARLSGDEFGVLLPSAGRRHAERVAARLLAALREPVELDGRPTAPYATIGIADWEPELTPDDLLRQADAALHAAKSAAPGDYLVYQAAVHAPLLRRVALGTDLRMALQRDEFYLDYQPIVTARSQAVVGVEALVRWRNPQRGLVPPDEFISVAEHTGAIHDLGRWVLDTACRAVAAFDQPAASADLGVSVNVSTRQLQRPGFVSEVADALAASGLAAERLTLEITESSLVDSFREATEPLRAIRELGARVAIDDFGTGYSSFNYLRQLPIDSVKIDRSFIEGIATRSEEWPFASAIVRLIKALGLTTVAEGVETGAQLAHVRALGCDLAQGYYFGRPRPLAALAEMAISGEAPKAT